MTCSRVPTAVPPWTVLLAMLLAAGAAPAQAQTAAPAPASAASAPRATPATPQRVEVTGGRPSDEAERRQSTTTKIVIGREELDKFGDATLGEVMRRLPGVSTPGAPGRSGGPRLRGLGGGYTQILLDGQRTPPGFTVESISPEQVERIEILRAPTAETGTRAIAGTINIITREGFKRRVNELRAGAQVEGGRASPDVSFTRNGSLGDGAYNLSLSAGEFNRRDDARVHTERADGSTLDETSLTRGWRQRLQLTARVQLPLGRPGDTLILQPTVFHVRYGSRFDGTAEGSAATYALASAEPSGRFSLGRLNATWRQALASNLRLEVNGGVSLWESALRSERTEFDAALTPLGALVTDSGNRQRSANVTAKLTRNVGEDGSWVSGLELETTERQQRSLSLDSRPSSVDAVPTDDDGALDAASLRAAGYTQYESTLTPNWSAYAGLRWEGIRTTGALTDGTHPKNRSSVWTPLLHAVWKPDPKGRDQVRFALTRSYRSPDLSNLVALRSVSANNGPDRPDRIGNPDLRPELATSLDVAYEHYLAEGGMLSVNLFTKRFTDFIRTVTRDVDPGADALYLARPENIGDAASHGLELEARLRADQLFGADAPRTELRANAAVYRSRVTGVPGPDNRVADQASGLFNLGLDHRFRGAPLTVGGSFNWAPGYRTQLSESSWSVVATKRVLDVYGLWTVNADVAVRLLASNLLAQDYDSVSGFEFDDGSQTVTTTTARSRPSLQLRLEFKL